MKIFLSAIIALLVLLNACTDIPMSYSTLVTDSRILGFWQENDSSAVEIKTNSSRNKVIVQLYKFDFSNGRFVYDGGEKNTYITSIEDKTGKENFLSINGADAGEDAYYENCNFKINSLGDLTIRSIDDEFLKKFQKTKSTDVSLVVLSNTTSFQNIVKTNLRNPKLYESSVTYSKRKDFSSLLKPKREVIIAKNNSTPSRESLERKNCTSSTYKAIKMQTQEYIKDLKTWDDWSAEQDVTDKNYTIRFLENGIIVKLGEVSFNAAGFSFKESDTNSNRYYGYLKKDGQTVGGVTLWIFNHTYQELTKGGLCNVTVQMSVDNTTFSNLLENWMHGADQFGLWLKLGATY